MFTQILYYIIYSIFYFISILPFWLLYLISDFFYILLFYIIGYRKKVAYQNLKGAFPEKTDAEIRQILKESYKHLADMFIEFFKVISIDAKDLDRRFTLINPEIKAVINSYPKGDMILATHYGNFEWLVAWASSQLNKKSYGIYSPLSSAVFEKLVVKTRERWGGELLPMKAAIQNSLSKIDSPCVIGFICDQSPTRRKTLYFTKFFGLPTAVHDRFAHLALMKEAPCYFAHIKKIKRGYYTIELIQLPIADYLPYTEPNAYRFVDDYTALLEKNIRENPAFWLWTHKKWKHSPTATDIFSPTLKPL